jgi:hypothetical protein
LAKLEPQRSIITVRGTCKGLMMNVLVNDGTIVRNNSL